MFYWNRHLVKHSTISISYVGSSSYPESALYLRPSSWLMVRPCRPKAGGPGLASLVWPRLLLEKQTGSGEYCQSLSQNRICDSVHPLWNSSYHPNHQSKCLQLVSKRHNEQDFFILPPVLLSLLFIKSYIFLCDVTEGPDASLIPSFGHLVFVLFATLVIIHYSSCKSSPLNPTIMISIIRWNIVWDL